VTGELSEATGCYRAEQPRSEPSLLQQLGQFPRLRVSCQEADKDGARSPWTTQLAPTILQA